MKGFLAFVLCLSVANTAESEEEWKAWKTLYGKKYFNDTEEQARHAIWRENLKVSYECIKYCIRILYVRRGNMYFNNYTTTIVHFT